MNKRRLWLATIEVETVIAVICISGVAQNDQ